MEIDEARYQLKSLMARIFDLTPDEIEALYLADSALKTLADWQRKGENKA